MTAKLQSVPGGIAAVFERKYNHSAGEVWAYLTSNDLLPKWFPELRVEELRTGGSMIFDLQDGNLIPMEISECTPGKVLEYSWGEDKVRFELSVEGSECRLLLIENIGRLTDHTPRDLAGWHVCLEVIGALLDVEEFPERKRAWEHEYEVYRKLVEDFRK